MAESVSEDVLVLLRKTRRTSTTRVVLIMAELTEQAMFRAAGCGVAGLVPRSKAMPEHLVHVIETVAAGDGYMPPTCWGRSCLELARCKRTCSAHRDCTSAVCPPPRD